MKRTLSRSAWPAVALLTMLAACDSAPRAHIAGPEAAPVDLSTGATQGEGGAVVVQLQLVDRFQSFEFLLHLDQDRSLMSVHAPSDICLDGQFGVLDVKTVTTPSHIGQFIAQTKGDAVPAAIYEASSFAEAGVSGTAGIAGILDIVDIDQLCSFLLGPKRIAEGTVRRVSNLSNASFAVTWTGHVEWVGGGKAMLTEIYQLTADAQDPNDTSKWVVNASKILLR